MGGGFWEGRTVLITGAGGFAGSSLAKVLVQKGAKVKAFIKYNGNMLNLEGLGAEVVRGDVADLTSVLRAMKGVDTVFHAGAIVPVEESRSIPLTTLNVNILGTYNVGFAALQSGARKMVHVSTCHIYGNQPPENLPLTEKTFPLPNDLYASSKFSAELVLRQLLNDGLNVTITRAFNHYGPGQTGNFLVSRVIKQILQGKAPVLGSPHATRDYSYVDDITEGYAAAGEKGTKGEIYHFSSGKETNIGELVEKTIKACRSDLRPVWASERKDDISRSYGDSSKARKQLGWAPKVGLEEGLKKTVEWWKARPLLYANA